MAWHADQTINLSLKLFGPPWQPYAQQDLLVRPQANNKTTLTRFHLTPRFGTAPGEYTLLATASLPDGTPLLLPDGNTAATLTPLTITGSSWQPVTMNRILGSQWRAVFQPNKAHIIGYDWDNTFADSPRLFVHWRGEDGRYWTQTAAPPIDPLAQFSRAMPNTGTSHYVPFAQGIVWLGSSPPLRAISLGESETISTSQQFVATRPIQRDLGVAVRLVGYEVDNFTWAWLNPDADNDIPAMGGIPTLKWVQGSAVNHPRRLTVSEKATAGQTVGGFLRIYDVFTNRPLPILDERYTADGRPWVTFDSGTVAPE